MAREISSILSVTVQEERDPTGFGNASFVMDATNVAYLGNEQQLIGVTPQTIFLGEIGVDPIFTLIYNLDPVNFITVDSVSTMNAFPQKILAGHGVYLFPQTGTIYCKADTAPCNIWVVAA